MRAPDKPERVLEIILELLKLTRKMAKSESSDFLVEAIDRRGELMAEYDMLKSSNPASAALIEKNKAKISQAVSEILLLDKKINKSLFSMYHDAKTDLQASNRHNKILNYTNQAISSSGSYIDFKE